MGEIAPIPYADSNTPDPSSLATALQGKDSFTQWGIAYVIRTDDQLLLAPSPFRFVSTAVWCGALFLLMSLFGIVGTYSPTSELKSPGVFVAAGFGFSLILWVVLVAIYRLNRRKGDWLVIDFRERLVRLPRLNRTIPLEQLSRFEIVQLYRWEDLKNLSKGNRSEVQYTELQAIFSTDTGVEDRVLVIQPMQSNLWKKVIQPLANFSGVPVLSVMQKTAGAQVKVSRVEPKS